MKTYKITDEFGFVGIITTTDAMDDIKNNWKDEHGNPMAIEIEEV